jgi:hypothetical protein
MDPAAFGWDRRRVTAATLRRSSVTAADVVRAQVALLGALLVGGVLVVAVAAVVGDDGRATWWAAVAGGFACASGLVFGATRRLGVAGGLGLVAVVAVVVAASGGVMDDSRGAAYPAAPAAADDGSMAAADDGSVAAADDRRASAAGAAAGRGAAPGRVVRDYYAALDRRRFRVAWRRLEPGVRAGFGGFVVWRRGYGSTLGHRVEDVRVERDGRSVAVRHDLVAVDRTPCGGTTERRFEVTWRLERGRATALTARKIAGVDPAQSC